jgi:hypothetical protein
LWLVEEVQLAQLELALLLQDWQLLLAEAAAAALLTVALVVQAVELHAHLVELYTLAEQQHLAKATMAVTALFLTRALVGLELVAVARVE